MAIEWFTNNWVTEEGNPETKTNSKSKLVNWIYTIEKTHETEIYDKENTDKNSQVMPNLLAFSSIESSAFWIKCAFLCSTVLTWVYYQVLSLTGTDPTSWVKQNDKKNCCCVHNACVWISISIFTLVRINLQRFHVRSRISESHSQCVSQYHAHLEGY